MWILWNNIHTKYQCRKTIIVVHLGKKPLAVHSWIKSKDQILTLVEKPFTLTINVKRHIIVFHLEKKSLADHSEIKTKVVTFMEKHLH